MASWGEYPGPAPVLGATYRAGSCTAVPVPGRQFISIFVMFHVMWQPCTEAKRTKWVSQIFQSLRGHLPGLQWPWQARCGMSAGFSGFKLLQVAAVTAGRVPVAAEGAAGGADKLVVRLQTHSCLPDSCQRPSSALGFVPPLAVLGLVHCKQTLGVHALASRAAAMRSESFAHKQQSGRGDPTTKLGASQNSQSKMSAKSPKEEGKGHPASLSCLVALNSEPQQPPAHAWLQELVAAMHPNAIQLQSLCCILSSQHKPTC